MKKIFTFLFIITVTTCFSPWSSSPTANTAVCTSATGQTATRIVADGNGGAIITWWDYDASTNDYDIYAQRINVSDVRRWSAGGVPMSTGTNNQGEPQIISAMTLLIVSLNISKMTLNHLSYYECC